MHQLTDDLVELLSVIEDEGIDLSGEGVVDLGGVLKGNEERRVEIKSALPPFELTLPPRLFILGERATHQLRLVQVLQRRI